jgi:glycolate oxidase iron-sulfur subunit
VDIVADLKCCGLPHLGSGEESPARELAAFNAGLIKHRSPDAIVSDCASCSSTLKGHIYNGLFPAGYDERIMDAQVFISKLADFFSPSKEIASQIVTYHDSCHLSKALKITTQPRELLKKIPGVTYVEMKDADKCCGGAGTYPMTNFGMSMKILGRKMANISDTGADVVAAACPGCITQISFGAKDKKLAVKVKHPLEILAGIF